MYNQKLPIGIQSFEDIRTNGYVYVDKTEYIWNLISSGKVYFLSRPRRFGKSLLISTIMAYFQGKRDLFRGLDLEKHEKEWQKYPVIYFSLSDGDFQTDQGIKDKFSNVIESTAEEYGVETALRGETLPVRFNNLIEQLYRKTKRQAVVLVDEYDKPLLDTMEINIEQEEKNRMFYKGFFGALKSQDAHLKFVFFTGVTKFSKVSVFSDLNQLNDISMDDRYSGICGITEEELQQKFQREIQIMAKANGQTYEECMERLAQMYDGYHFSKKGVAVYNPFSILNAFDKEDYGRYWFSTGTPTFLIQKLRKSSFTAEQFANGVEATEMELSDYRIDNPNPIPLFYQSGYLTIKDYDREFRIFTLNFPNEEVKFGFFNSLLPDVLGEREADNPMPLRTMIVSLRNGNIDAFMAQIEALFAGIPYAEKAEHSYEYEWRNEIYLILVLLGQNVKCEVHSARGRADCIAETQKFVYVFEFKLDQSAEEALKQIDEKGYADVYKADSRTVCKIGVDFSSKKRNIESWMTNIDSRRKE